MAKVCQITGKRPLNGHRVSHAQNKCKHRFKPNLQTKRILLPTSRRRVRLRLSTHAMRLIDRHGIEKVLAKWQQK